MCSPGERDTSLTGKLIASLTTCHKISSGTSAPANGRATRKHTSVNGSRRNSSSSSGERRAISTGMYNPPSGASPRSTAPRSEVSGAFRAVLRYLIRKISSRAFEFVLSHLQERLSARRSIARNVTQLCDRKRAVRQHLVALPPGGDQCGVASRHGFAWCFPRSRLKRAAPQDRLGISHITLDQELLFFRRHRQIHYRHLPPQPHEQVISGVNHASCRIENQLLLPIPLQHVQDFVERVNLFREILGFASRVGRTIRPAHPGSNAVDSGVSAGGKPRRQLLLDAVVAGDAGPPGL